MTKTFKVELWDIDKVKPYPKNAKNHPPEQIARLAKTISKFGWDQPIVVDKDGVIIKGHGRRLAAIHIYMTKVPVIVRDDLTKEEADAARISDNSVSSTSYDTNMLQEELKRIMGTDSISFSLEDMGLSDKEQTLLMEELDIAEINAIMDDTHKETDKQRTADQERIEASDREEIRVAEAFGFKTVRRDDARTINAFISVAEDATGLAGREAFFAHLKTIT
jgi:hypothetical protein